MPVTPDLLTQLNAAVADVVAASGDVGTSKTALDAANQALSAATVAADGANHDFTAKHQALVDKVNALEAIAEQLKN